MKRRQRRSTSGDVRHRRSYDSTSSMGTAASLLNTVSSRPLRRLVTSDRTTQLPRRLDNDETTRRRQNHCTLRLARVISAGSKVRWTTWESSMQLVVVSRKWNAFHSADNALPPASVSIGCWANFCSHSASPADKSLTTNLNNPGHRDLLTD